MKGCAPVNMSMTVKWITVWKNHVSSVEHVATHWSKTCLSLPANKTLLRGRFYAQLTSLRAEISCSAPGCTDLNITSSVIAEKFSGVTRDSALHFNSLFSFAQQSSTGWKVKFDLCGSLYCFFSRSIQMPIVRSQGRDDEICNQYDFVFLLLYLAATQVSNNNMKEEHLFSFL